LTTELNTDLIAKDLASFADPSSEIVIQGRRITWVQRRQPQAAKLLLSADSDAPDVEFEGTRYSYPGFFASEKMGDLRGLAESMGPYIQQLPSFVGPAYIDSPARTPESAQTVGALALCQSMTATSSSENRTRIVFLRGRAGDGKSSLLVQLAHQQASAYLEGRATWLYFYIDAQGQALSRVDQAIAKIKDDLRASFTYHAVATLTRLGLLVPIIDGFDELLGIGGYDDAFSSLSTFVNRLGGRGCVFASARATFFEVSGLRSAHLAASLTGDVEVATADLEPWTDSQVAQLLDRSGYAAGQDPVAAVVKLRGQLSENADEVLSSPFLVTQLLALLRSDGRLQGSGVVGALVLGFLAREVDKLKDRDGSPILTLEQHVSLCERLAEEMWMLEVRELETDTVLLLAELMCDEFGLQRAAADAFVQRIRSHALLSTAPSQERVQFRHEYYYGFFLGRALLTAALAGASVLAPLLSRAVLSTVVATELARAVPAEDAVKHASAFVSIASARFSRVSEYIGTQNVGSLLAALLREHPRALPAGSAVSGARFDGVSLRRTVVERLRFTECDFQRVDFRGARWRAVEFLDCTFTLPKLSAETRLESTGILLTQIHGMSLDTHDTYNPAEITEALASAGTLVELHEERELSDNAKSFIARLDELLRIVATTTRFTADDFTNRRRKFSDYEDVMRLLQRCGLIVVDQMGRRGTSPSIYRVSFAPEQLREGEGGVFATPEIEAFWTRVWQL
jgi:hypothetical protein